MRIKYDKLVRDRIPDIIRQAGKTPTVRVADPTELTQLLEAKLKEETEELLAPTADRPKELADILEVLHALARQEDMSPDDLEDLRRRKAKDRGGFKEGIVLLEVDSNSEFKAED
jgi:predicted house-cleaning noncanonical NTP pyrophosphatase (MazG superfamily)